MNKRVNLDVLGEFYITTGDFEQGKHVNRRLYERCEYLADLDIGIFLEGILNKIGETILDIEINERFTIFYHPLSISFCLEMKLDAILIRTIVDKDANRFIGQRGFDFFDNGNIVFNQLIKENGFYKMKCLQKIA